MIGHQDVGMDLQAVDMACFCKTANKEAAILLVLHDRPAIASALDRVLWHSGNKEAWLSSHRPPQWT
jgi:hypothetical protein